MATVSETKQLLLDDDKSLREWTKALKEDSKPSEGYIDNKVVNEYNAALMGTKGQRGLKWLDEWEAIMAKAIYYDIAELKKGRWLRDFAFQIRLVAESFSDKLLDKANNSTLQKP